MIAHLSGIALMGRAFIAEPSIIARGMTSGSLGDILTAEKISAKVGVVTLAQGISESSAADDEHFRAACRNVSDVTLRNWSASGNFDGCHSIGIYRRRGEESGMIEPGKIRSFWRDKKTYSAKQLNIEYGIIPFVIKFHPTNRDGVWGVSCDWFEAKEKFGAILASINLERVLCLRFEGTRLFSHFRDLGLHHIGFLGENRDLPISGRSLSGALPSKISKSGYGILQIAGVFGNPATLHGGASRHDSNDKRKPLVEIKQLEKACYSILAVALGTVGVALMIGFWGGRRLGVIGRSRWIAGIAWLICTFFLCQTGLP